MLRSGALTLAVAIVFPIGCGSASEEGLFGPPNPSAWTGARSSSAGGSASGGSGGVGGTGGIGSSGGTNTGGSVETGGTSTGGVSTGGSQNGGAGGLDPSTGGSSSEIGSPGVISCSGIPCRSDMSPANTCCLGGIQSTCRPEFLPCSVSGASSFHCDDAADCGGGAICCASATADGLTTTDCTTECSGSDGAVQLCRTNRECPEGRECKPWGQLPEFSSCQ